MDLALANRAFHLGEHFHPRNLLLWFRLDVTYEINSTPKSVGQELDMTLALENDIVNSQTK